MHKDPDYLIKVWWAIMEWGDDLKGLITLLEETSEKKRIVLTTWSKDLSNVIRRYVSGILPGSIDEETHIDITMQSRDMMALAFAHVSDKFKAVDSVWSVHSAIAEWNIPVLLQYGLLKSLRPFPLKRWLSTDTTSAYFADLLKTRRFIKLTDVDGVYDKLGEWVPYSTIRTTELKEKWRTCVDITLPDLLDKIRMKCYVMNGKNIPNLKKFLQYWSGVHTCIEPNQ